MRLLTSFLAAGSLCTFLGGATQASEFDNWGAAPATLVATEPTPNVIIELGLGAGAAPVYEGASDLGLTFNPIIRVEKLYIPGLLDIGGDEQGRGGFAFAPSFSMAKERVSADHDALDGLEDVDATYALGARVGYEVVLSEAISAEAYGAARYAFGGAKGFVGEVGIDVTARLTPQLELVGGPVVNLASEDYMDTYFGVTSAEAAASGGRLDAYDSSGGIKSVGLKVGARYEFIADTFLNLDASYASFAGDARESPIVASGARDQVTFGLGLSRKFAF